MLVWNFVRADRESCHTARYMYDNTALEQCLHPLDGQIHTYTHGLHVLSLFNTSLKLRHVGNLRYVRVIHIRMSSSQLKHCLFVC